MDTQATESVLTSLKQEREWQFEVEGASGEKITCYGSEPNNEEEVAKLIHPVNDAQLLYWRSVAILHDSPSFEDNWEDITPTNKAIIASKHLENWNAFDLISEEQIAEAKQRIINQEIDF